MKGNIVFRITECEEDLVKYKNNVQLNKCIKDLEGATAKCDADIAEVERVYKVQATEASDEFDIVNTEKINATKKARKCKQELTTLKIKYMRKCPI